MLYVSIFVELLRARPALAVWLAAALQALIWTLVPTFFYPAPPGDVPFVIAVGHEWQLGSYLGPPLAFWLAELAFVLSGRSLFGVYLLSQICVVATYWAVFSLGRLIVGAQQAALATLLMVGISTLSVPTPDFGPPVLAMPLWALVLLHYWRAVGEGKRAYWVAAAVEIGLLLLTSYAGLVLVGLLALFTAIDKDARASLRAIEPWLAVFVACVVAFPHVLWLTWTRDGAAPALLAVSGPDSIAAGFTSWLRQVASIIAVHAGALVLLALVVGFPWVAREPAPVIVRRPLDQLSRQFVFVFAGAPALVATIIGAALGLPGPVGGIAPLVVMSGLAIIVLAGDAIELSHQHVVIFAWFGLLLVPPIMAVVALALMPWVGIELSVNQPAAAMSNFFAESFQRRLGRPLTIVAGEPRTAALIALGVPSRASLVIDAERTPWVTPDDIKARGAIVVWPTMDTAGLPPADIGERFPNLVPEVPRAFERPLQGRLNLLRVGWAVIRPQAEEKAQPAEEGEAKPPEQTIPP